MKTLLLRLRAHLPCGSPLVKKVCFDKSREVGTLCDRIVIILVPLESIVQGLSKSCIFFEKYSETVEKYFFEFCKVEV